MFLQGAVSCCGCDDILVPYMRCYRFEQSSFTKIVSTTPLNSVKTLRENSNNPQNWDGLRPYFTDIFFLLRISKFCEGAFYLWAKESFFHLAIIPMLPIVCICDKVGKVNCYARQRNKG